MFRQGPSGIDMSRAEKHKGKIGAGAGCCVGACCCSPATTSVASGAAVASNMVGLKGVATTFIFCGAQAIGCIAITTFCAAAGYCVAKTCCDGSAEERQSINSSYRPG